MTITKEQETTIEMTLMDYFLDMEDFIQGNKTLRYIHETGTVEPEAFEMLRQEIKEMNKVIMTEFKEGNLLKENANYESTTNQED